MTKSRTVLVIAGEASGDRIASRAVRSANRLASERNVSISFYGIGGDECSAEGVECLHTAREMSVVGFVEVARRFRFFRRVFHEMVAQLDGRKPDAVLLVDYPGFNIRFAREAKKRGIRVIYYVSPQVWAWHRSRIQELKEVVDEMLVIFPFEEKLYRDAGMVNVHFVGHPLVERIEEERKYWSDRTSFARKHGLDPDREWLLIFSGSRSEEVRRLLPTMSEAAEQFSETHTMQTILVESSTIAPEVYRKYSSRSILSLRSSEATHELMYHAQIGILKSGTTTLEAALLGLPGVICYRTHPLTFFIGKRLVQLPYIGLANIVLGKKMYPELLQTEMTPDRIAQELETIYASRNEFRKQLDGISSSLIAEGRPPSEQVAERLLV